MREDRIKKLEVLREAGRDPYPAKVNRSHTVDELQTNFDSLINTSTIPSVAGRILSLRDHGNSIFCHISDGTGRIQLYIKKSDIGEESFELFTKTIDRGDFIQVTGTLFFTKRGERTIQANTWNIIGKSLLPLPTEWFGLTNEDERYRKRYIDILLNEKSADLARRRSVFWNSFRSFLLSKEFIEVETPVLENTTGGADARPFKTHHNALDIDVYLRISAGELWQKELLVAGLPKVFEIGRIFRNEGMSREHLQDYTQLEFYEAYSDFEQGMEMVVDLYRQVAQETFGTTQFIINGHAIDLAKSWDTYDYCELIESTYGIHPLKTSISEIGQILNSQSITYDLKSLNIERGVDLLWKNIRKTISGPGFLVGVPVFMEPLAKRSATNPATVERFQVLLAGSEMGKGFSELNDPIDQRERFEHQQHLRDAGDEEAHMPNFDFVEALEYGMPPAFGFGCSERLFSFLAGVDVREGQLFPLMRPKPKDLD